MDIAAEDAHSEGVEDFFLDRALERSSPIDRVVSGGGDLSFGGIGEFKGDAAVGKAIHKARELDFDDLLDLRNAQGSEHHDVIQSVDELGAKVEPEFFDYLGFDFLELLGIEEAVAVVVASDVGSENDYRVLEVHGSALTIGQASVIQELEEDVENIGVGFLDFVEKDDAVGSSADDFGELTAFFVTDVSRRGTDQAGDGVLFAVFGHVNPHHGAIVVEEKFGEGFGGFSFSDSSGAKEEKTSDWTIGVADSGTVAADRVAENGESLVLSDYSTAKHFFHLDELLEFAFHELGDGDASPTGNNAGDVFFRDFLFEEGGFGGLVSFGELGFEFGELTVLNFGGAAPISISLSGLEFCAELFNLLFESTEGFDFVLFGLPSGSHRVGLFFELTEF